MPYLTNEIAIPSIDILAFLWFVVCWVGYANFANNRSTRVKSLKSMLYIYQYQWLRQLQQRPHHLIVDSSLLLGLKRSANFFASSSMLILAATATLLSTAEQGIRVVTHLPFAVTNSTLLWELKTINLLAIFAYSFFKFTWSIRQFNFFTMIIGGAPSPNETNDDEKHVFAKQGAKVVALATHDFNSGLRSYYFGLASLGWFVNPWLFIIGCTGVVYLLYRREFKSKALRALINAVPASWHKMPKN
jgi:uncharacterized membrane protein